MGIGGGWGKFLLGEVGVGIGGWGKRNVVELGREGGGEGI